MTKPFSPREVVSRVRAVLRRGRLPATSREVYLDGELTLEGSCFIVSVRGKRVLLSSPEWWLLRRLAEQAGRVVPREELIHLLWGEDELIHQHELDRSVQTLKRELEKGVDLGDRIITIPGIGYLLTHLTE